jgi:hypothetical protein
MTQVNKGKSVRATQLVAGTDYVMGTWTKERTFETVRFLGFGSINAPEAIPQLKTMTANSKFFFQKGDELLVADGRNAGSVFIGEGDGHRVTFFAVSAEAAAPEPVAVTEAAAEEQIEEVTATTEANVEA